MATKTRFSNYPNLFEMNRSLFVNIGRLKQLKMCLQMLREHLLFAWGEIEVLGALVGNICNQFL